MIRTLLCLLLLSFQVFAQAPLKPPVGEVILEVRGLIQHTNIDEEEAHFDRAMIEALPSATIITSNHVMDKATTYKGPRLSDLLDLVGAQGNSILVTALDDYAALIQRKDIDKYGVLLATHENGRLMTIDDRGPFFIVFPFDDNKELQQDLYYNMSVWQISSIEVE